MTDDSSKATKPAQQAADDEAPVDDQKAKFLAALEAKKHQGKGPHAQKHEGGGGGGHEHGAAGGKREFRRKSGG
jgi:hypothetical protein